MAIAVAGAATAQDPQQKSKAAAAQPQKKDQAQAQAQAQDEKIDGTFFHAQVLLDRAGFSPGVIDGLKGISFDHAVKGFQESRGLQITGELDQPTRAALLRDQAPSTIRLRIDPSDAEGPFTPIPKEPEAQAKMERLAYRKPAREDRREIPYHAGDDHRT
jgi:peptidoglycan hydrolase-like protein with peptidoglycan-binding domain